MNKVMTALITTVTLSSVVAGNTFAKEKEYDVKQGDSLWGISQKYNTTVDNIKTWNHLNTDLIFPDQKLKITPAKENKTYTVKDTDTLSDIAHTFGVSVNDLRNWNQLDSDTIHPGQSITLKINDNIKQLEKLAAKEEKKKAAKVAVQHVSYKKAEAKPQQVKQPVETKKKATTSSQDNNTTNNASSNNTQSAKTVTVSATGYTADCSGCSGVTATGIDVKSNPGKKVISVDPSVIPLGSKVYVEGYGYAVAGDTGGAIKGNRIDLLFSSEQEALNWGRKTVKVKIVD